MILSYDLFKLYNKLSPFELKVIPLYAGCGITSCNQINVFLAIFLKYIK